MKEERYHLTLDRYDKNIVINALNILRTQQIQEERPTDPVDELISKVAHAPTKKVRVVPPESGRHPCRLRYPACCVDRPAYSPFCGRRSGRGHTKFSHSDAKPVFHNGM